MWQNLKRLQPWAQSPRCLRVFVRQWQRYTKDEVNASRIAKMGKRLLELDSEVDGFVIYNFLSLSGARNQEKFLELLASSFWFVPVALWRDKIIFPWRSWHLDLGWGWRWTALLWICGAKSRPEFLNMLWTWSVMRQLWGGQQDVTRISGALASTLEKVAVLDTWHTCWWKLRCLWMPGCCKDNSFQNPQRADFSARCESITLQKQSLSVAFRS